MDKIEKDSQTRQIDMMRIQTILIACILIIVAIVGIALISQYKNIQGCIDIIEQKIQTIDTEALNEAVIAFKDRAEQLGNSDIDSINALVTALSDVAARLQNSISSIPGIFGR